MSSGEHVKSLAPARCWPVRPGMGCPPVEVVGVAVLVRGGQSIQRFRQLIKVGLVAGEAGDIPRLPSVGAVANASKAVPCLALPAIMLRRPLG